MQTVITKSKNELTISVNNTTVTTVNKITSGNFAGKQINSSWGFETNRQAVSHYFKLVRLNRK